MVPTIIKNKSFCKLKEKFESPSFCSNLLILILILLFIERVVAMFILGTDYNLANDDMGYINSGITFAHTGVISIYSQYPSAMIMPGLPVLCGAFYLVFGEGDAFWIALKLLYCLFGTLTALAVYKSVKLFAPKGFGLLSMLPFFLPNAVWMNNIILTETPYCFFLAWSVYYALSMGKNLNAKNSVLFSLTFFGALMFRNIALIIPFAAFAYLLLIKRGERKRVLAASAGVWLLIAAFAPWCIRNYRLFDAFIPYTYGAGSPTLQGTYQGWGWPEDSELDYKTNADDVFREEYSSYFDANGDPVDPAQTQYLTLSSEMIKAKYRMSVWFSRSPFKFLTSYLLIKPMTMTVAVFYWKDLFGCPKLLLTLLRLAGCFFAAGAVILCLIKRRHVEPVVFLSVFYIASLLVTSISFSFDRYGEVLMFMRYIIVALGIEALLNRRVYEEKE